MSLMRPQHDMDPAPGDLQLLTSKQRLTILCLHGFRQNASQFKGRLRALQKKLSNVAELVFIDAPYVLPLWYKTTDNTASEPLSSSSAQQNCQQQHERQHFGSLPREQQCQHHPQQQQQQQQQHHPQQQQQQQQHRQQHPKTPTSMAQNTSNAARTFPASLPNPKRAWLLSEDLVAAQPQLQQLSASSPQIYTPQQDKPQQHHQQQQQQQQQTNQQQEEQQQQLAQQLFAASPQMQTQQQDHTQQHTSKQQQQQQQQQPPLMWSLAPAHMMTTEQYTTQACGWDQPQKHHQQHTSQQQQQQLAQQPPLMWSLAPAHLMTTEQYTTQACGWQASWEVIQAALLAGPAQLQQQQQQAKRQQQKGMRQQQQKGTRQQQLAEGGGTMPRQQQEHRAAAQADRHAVPQSAVQLYGILGFSQQQLRGQHCHHQQQQLADGRATMPRQQQEHRAAAQADRQAVPQSAMQFDGILGSSQQQLRGQRRQQQQQQSEDGGVTMPRPQQEHEAVAQIDRQVEPQSAAKERGVGNQPQLAVQFDGILGFSQGAAVAAVVAALCQQQRQQQQQQAESGFLQAVEAQQQQQQQQQQQAGSRCLHAGETQQQQQQQQADRGCLHAVEAQQQRQQQQQQPAVQTAATSNRTPFHSCSGPETPNPLQAAHTLPHLKFVIIASGFVSPCEPHRQLLTQQSPIKLPSLHLYASVDKGGADRQIQQQQSEQLLGLFEEGSRQVITHAGGHMLPTDPDSVVQMKQFLKQFLA